MGESCCQSTAKNADDTVVERGSMQVGDPCDEVPPDDKNLFSIMLDRTAGKKPLGIDVWHSDRHNDSLAVRGFGTSGLVLEWNANNPGREVRLGDKILEVNSVRGCAVDMLGECQQMERPMLKMLVCRGDGGFSPWSPSTAA